MRFDRRVSIAAAAMLAAAVLFPLLGHKLLTDWDEGIYAEVSREMLRGGWRGWLTPHWNGQLWFEKPPLMLWITACFFRAFGVTEFWARAGSALSGVAIVGVLHGWLGRRDGLVAAWVGTGALLSTTGFLHICRVGEMDTLLSLGCVVALVGLVAVGEERSRGWFGFWIGFALAAMTKGSASVIIPLTAVTLATIERWGWRRFGREFWVGLAVFAGLVLPWHLAMWRLYGVAFLREYIGFHVLARATGVIEGHTTPWWFYGRVLWVSAMPWILALPFAVWRGWRRSEARVWIVFVGVVVGFFSVVQTRLPHYVAPVYPAMAVVAGLFIADEAERLRSLTRLRLVAVGAVIAMVWSGSVLLTAGARKQLHSASGSGGWTTAEEREAIALVRDARTLEADGPLLVWWTEPQRSVASTAFYARRVVERVWIDRSSAGERYTSAGQSLHGAVGKEPALILFETKLVPAIPTEFVYSRMQAGPTMEIGIIRRR